MRSDGAAVSGIVLAGGRAQRFGGDKLAALLRDGRPILAHAVAAVSSICDEVVVVLAPDGDDPVGLPAATRFVRDKERYGGPLAALRVGLEDVLGERVVIVGGDMPSLVPAVLERLVATLDENEAIDAAVLEPATSHDPDSVLDHDDRADSTRLQTLPSAVRTEAARRAVGAALDAGDRRLQGLFERLRLARIPHSAWRSLDPDGRTLTDVDRPADLSSAERRALRRPSGPPGSR